MILEKQPLTLAEVKEIVGKAEEKQELKAYLKKFTKLKVDKAIELKKEIEGLGNIKIKDESVVKIVDFLPADKEEIAKIFNDVGLDEAEANAILEIVKKYKK